MCSKGVVYFGVAPLCRYLGHFWCIELFFGPKHEPTAPPKCSQVPKNVSKRARQISEGSKALLDYYPDEPFNPMLLALKELELGKFTYNMEENYSEEDNMIEQMDKSLDEEISKENEPAPSPKETKKPKSKSLAI